MKQIWSEKEREQRRREEVVRHRMELETDIPSYDPMVFVDQVISVLKLVSERITAAESLAVTVDLGNVLVRLSKFINQPYERTFDVRIKTRFCAMLDTMFEKALPIIKNENIVRSSLFEVVADWIWEIDSVFVLIRILQVIN